MKQWIYGCTQALLLAMFSLGLTGWAGEMKAKMEENEG